MSYPVADLRRYLTGGWMLARSLRDRRSGALGSFVGWASLQDHDGTLDYSERGQMLFANYRGISFQSYRYSFPELGRADVHFTDGRLFHALDLTEGAAEAVHRCGDDVYRGRFEASGDGLWDSEWRVTGPRKELVISNRYIRSCR